MSICIADINKVTLLLALAKLEDTDEMRRATERFLQDQNDKKECILSYKGTIIYTWLQSDYIDSTEYNRYHGENAMETILSNLTKSSNFELELELDESQSLLC
jgi:hypothetical protein